MRSAFALAAFAGIAMAAPHYPAANEVVTQTFWETVYVTDGPAPTDCAESAAPAKPVVTPVYSAAPAPEYKPSVPSYPAAPAPSQAAPKAPASGGYMGVVDEWRSKLGLSPLTQDSQLENNARKCVTDSNGKMVHELNPGSYGQVLAPDQGGFEHVFVGGWLCEKPNMPGLDGACDTQLSGWDHSSGETGHADILTSGDYSKIGCALYNGIWACDVA